ncbi:unnamed protein product, partial [Prorocentrum cordatum]
MPVSQPMGRAPPSRSAARWPRTLRWLRGSCAGRCPALQQGQGGIPPAQDGKGLDEVLQAGHARGEPEDTTTTSTTEAPTETSTVTLTETTITLTETTMTLTETSATGTSTKLPPVEEVPGLISVVLKVRESCAQYGGVLHQDNVSCCAAACGDRCGAPDCEKWGPGCCGSFDPRLAVQRLPQGALHLDHGLGGRREQRAEGERRGGDHRGAPAATTGEDAEAADAPTNRSWRCHQYEGDQDIEWCKVGPVDDHFEYKFFGIAPS